MKQCRLCDNPLLAPDYASAPPSLSSNLQSLNVGTKVYLCRNCGLAQSPELADNHAYYDQNYRISLESDEHDQLVTLPSGEALFRNDLQCRLVLDHVSLGKGAKVLDFGGAKGTTLKKIVGLRSDLIPFIFDVSSDYAPAWSTWIKTENTAAHDVPANWQATFDLVILNFALEHIPTPVQVLRQIRTLLAGGGQLFVTVPNSLLNSGDFLVVDHVNHFSPHTLREMLKAAGFAVTTMDTEQLPAALLAVARKSDNIGRQHKNDDEQDATLESLGNWTRIRDNLLKETGKLSKTPAAIFGAGFYGNWVASTIKGMADIACFIDNNTHLLGTTIGHRPVYSPKDLPANIHNIFMGINPAAARNVAKREAVLAGKNLVFLE